SEQAMRISLANNTGEISAVLRGNTPEDSKAPASVSMRDLLDSGAKDASEEPAMTSEDSRSLADSAGMNASLLDSVLAARPPRGGAKRPAPRRFLRIRQQTGEIASRAGEKSA